MFRRKKPPDIEEIEEDMNLLYIPDELRLEVQTFSMMLLVSVMTKVGSNPIMKSKYNELLGKGLTKEDILGSENKVIKVLRNRLLFEIENLHDTMQKGEAPENMANNPDALMLSIIGTISKEDKDNTEVQKMMDDVVTTILESMMQ